MLNTPDPQGVIDVAGLVKRFDAVLAVDHIDFSVPAGSTTALLGGNGAGKTTTLAMLLGLMTPSQGSIRVFGENMVTQRHKVLWRMNFSSPYVDLPARLTVFENLMVYAHLYGLDNPRGTIDRLAGELDMREFLHRRTGKLSAGQKTRVAIAKALLNDPDLLLLDEPTASLDPDTGDWVRTYLERFRERHGATILLASHNMAEVERLCDQVLMMRQGRIEERGSPPELRARFGRDNLEDVFLDVARQRHRSPDGEAVDP